MRSPNENVVAGERALGRRDPVMRGLIRQAGPADLGRRRNRSHFAELVRSIMYQQLAGRAAAAIHARFLALFDEGLSPEAVLAVPVKRLRDAGLSGAKAASVRDLAAKSLDGTVPLRGLSRLSDDEVVERLSMVRGIGPWTAEMFLMFQLARLDVWPVGDYGVRNGYQIAYGLPSMPSARELTPLGEPFGPYRSIAAWYCWQAVHLARGD